uniref:LY6/PLAUR domain containing 6B n=1 Tax=Strix occidentalis caurina TaxID=311401 RepID=A0A8D0FK06_STROC
LHFQTVLSALLVIMQRTITTVTDGLKIDGVLKVSANYFLAKWYFDQVEKWLYTAKVSHFNGNILLNCVKFLTPVKEHILDANTHFKFYFVGTQYCLTVHLFTDHGKSTSVTKKCATREECHFVGCHHHRESGHTECVSCCEGMICNVEIPTNHTNAVFAVLHARRTSDGSRRTVNVAVLVSVMMIALS